MVVMHSAIWQKQNSAAQQAPQLSSMVVEGLVLQLLYLGKLAVINSALYYSILETNEAICPAS